MFSDKEFYRKEMWKQMTRFESVNDIPSLPVTTEEEWNNFYLPILIKCGAIPKKNLVKGAYYNGSCRNTEVAMWDGEKFIYERTKFGMKYMDKINHFEDDNGFDLFVPLKRI
jgi:hypothetical protein